MCCPKGKCGCQYFILLTLKKQKFMDTVVLEFFLINKLILDYYFCLKSGPVFLFQIFIIAPLPNFCFFKVNNMKYWHPHLPFGQHMSVSTLVVYKYNLRYNILSTSYKIYICILFGSFGLLTVLTRLELNGFQISLTFMNVIRETRRCLQYNIWTHGNIMNQNISN
jgi:hypothetical protein